MYASNSRMYGTNASNSKLAVLKEQSSAHASKKMEYSKHLEGLTVPSTHNSENRTSAYVDVESSACTPMNARFFEGRHGELEHREEQAREQQIRMHKLAIKEQQKQFRRQQKQAQIFAHHQYRESQVAMHHATYKQQVAMHHAAAYYHPEQVAMAAYYHQPYYFQQETNSHDFAFPEYGIMKCDAPAQYSSETHFSRSSEEQYLSQEEAGLYLDSTPAEAGLYVDSHDDSCHSSEQQIPSKQPCAFSDSDYISHLIGKPLSLASVFAPPSAEVKETLVGNIEAPQAVNESNIAPPPGLDAPRDLMSTLSNSPTTERALKSENRFAPRTENSFAGLKPVAKANTNSVNIVQRCRFNKRQAAHKKNNANSMNKAPSKLHTWMLRNIPCKLYQDELMEILNTCGLEGKFDFFFTPVDAKKNALRKHKGAHDVQSNANNKGYAFINLKSAEDSDFLFRICNGKDFWTRFSNTNSKKRCIVCPAQNQGLLENIKFFKNSVLNHSLVAEYRNDCAQEGHATPSTVASSRWNRSPQMMSRRSASLSSESELGLASEGTFMEKSRMRAMEDETTHREQELVEKRKRIVEAMQMPFFEYDEADYAGVEHYVDSMMEKWNL